MQTCNEGRHSRSGSWLGGRGQAPRKWARARVPARVRACSAGEPETIDANSFYVHARGRGGSETQRRQATNVPAPHEAKSGSASSTQSPLQQRDSHEPLPAAAPGKARGARASCYAREHSACLSRASWEAETGVGFPARCPGARPVSCPCWEGRRVRVAAGHL